MKYDQPVFIPFDIRYRFRGIDAFGYLPPLEPPEPIEVKPPAIAELSRYLQEKIKRLDDLQGRMIFLTNKLNEHLDRSKKKTKDEFKLVEIVETVEVVDGVEIVDKVENSKSE